MLHLFNWNGFKAKHELIFPNMWWSMSIYHHFFFWFLIRVRVLNPFHFLPFALLSSWNLPLNFCSSSSGMIKFFVILGIFWRLGRNIVGSRIWPWQCIPSSLHELCKGERIVLEVNTWLIIFTKTIDQLLVHKLILSSGSLCAFIGRSQSLPLMLLVNPLVLDIDLSG